MSERDRLAADLTTVREELEYGRITPDMGILAFDEAMADRIIALGWTLTRPNEDWQSDDPTFIRRDGAAGREAEGAMTDNDEEVEMADVHCASCRTAIPPDRWPSHYRTKAHRIHHALAMAGREIIPMIAALEPIGRQIPAGRWVHVSVSGWAKHKGDGLLWDGVTLTMSGVEHLPDSLDAALLEALEGLIHFVKKTWSIPTTDCPHGDPTCGACEDQEGYRFDPAYLAAVERLGEALAR